MFKALILGATGETGSRLLKQLLMSDFISELTLILRSEPKNDFLDIIQDVKDSTKVEVKFTVIDFEQLKEKHANEFDGINVAYCCLGTTRSKAGAENFFHVDHDYVLSAAEVLKDKGCSQFHLLSSANANPQSSFLYLKTKGLIEKHVEELQFEHLHIYRPAVLLCDRKESRPLEAISRTFLKYFDFGNRMSTPIEAVARAMCLNSKDGGKLGTTVHANADILQFQQSN